MAYDPQNIFARILRGELPCIRLFEDEHTLSFMDIMPQSDGHALIVPKEAAETIFDLSEAGAVACIRTTQKIARAVQQAMNCAGILVMQLNGAEAGQTVPHIHFHVVPRYDRHLLLSHASEKADTAKLQAFAQRIIAAL